MHIYVYIVRKCIYICICKCVYIIFMHGNIDILTYLKLNKQFVCIFQRYSPDISPLVIS